MITISYLTEKFKEYRIKCPIDQNTNDYPKKLNGTNEDIDLYIDCHGNKKIFYSGNGILEAYIPSIKTGRNIIRQIYYENIIFRMEKLLRARYGRSPGNSWSLCHTNNL